MSYLDETINFDEIENRELHKVFPLFRVTKTWTIVAGIIFLLSNFYPLISVYVLGMLAGGTAGSMASGIAGLGIIINIIIVAFIYKCYTNGNTTALTILYVIILGFSIFTGAWASVLFYAWIGLSIYLSNKARENAQRTYNDLDAARKYSEERADRARMINQQSAPAETVAQPIDNSNIFGNPKPHNPDDDIELVSMDNVFARPNGAASSEEPKPYEVSPMASFNTAVAAGAATETEAAPSPFAPLASTPEAPKEDVPAPVEGFKGMRYCPKCSFALLPGEEKCSRCN